MTALLILAAAITAHTLALIWRAWAVEHARREAEQAWWISLADRRSDW